MGHIISYNCVRDLSNTGISKLFYNINTKPQNTNTGVCLVYIMNAWVHIGIRLTRGGGRCGHMPDPRCPKRSRGPWRADSLAETDSGCSWPRAAGEPPNESRCKRTSTEKQREEKKNRDRGRDREQVQPSPRDGNQREMKNKKEDKQRERGRVTQ